jgi:hypothetical protein
VHDGISWRGADLHAHPAASARIAIDLRATEFVLGDRSVDRALIDAKLARLPLVGEACHGVDSGGGHGQWKFLAKHAGLAGGNTWCVNTHYACLPDGLDERCSRSPLTSFGWRPHNGIWRASRYAVTTSCARGKKLTFRDGTWWPLKK